MKVVHQLASTFFLLTAAVSAASDDTTASNISSLTSTSYLRHRILPPSCENVRCAAGCALENPCAKGETCNACNDFPYTGCIASCTAGNQDCGGYYECVVDTTETTTATTTIATTAATSSATTVNVGVGEGDCLVDNTECDGKTGLSCDDCCGSFINTRGTKTCVKVLGPFNR